MEDIVKTLSTFTRVSSFFTCTPIGSATLAGEVSFFAGNKAIPYSAQREDYFSSPLAAAGGAFPRHALKLLPMALIPHEGPATGEMVQFFLVEAAISCQGLVGKFGRKICIREIQGYNIDKHSSKSRVYGTLGVDPELTLVDGYYL